MIAVIIAVVVAAGALVGDGDPNATVIAANRTATAIAKQRDELANCVAQGKCPTATPTPSRLPTPAPTATPLPTSTSLPDSPTPTPAPSLPIPAEGSDWLSGYLRPSDWNDGATIELALPTGRWYVRLDDPTCAGPWTNAMLAPDAQLVVRATADHLSWVATCNLIGASWQSNAPCALDEDGLCDVLADTSYWDMLGHLPTPEPEITSMPTSTPRPVAPAPAIAARPAPVPPASEPVSAPAVPTQPAHLAAPTAHPTATFVLIPTPTPVPTVVPATATPVATPVADARVIFAMPTPTPSPSGFGVVRPDWADNLPRVIGAGIAGLFAIGLGFALWLSRVGR